MSLKSSLKKIFNDEIQDAAFVAKWLKNLKDPVTSPWKTWIKNIHHRITPLRAKGPTFYPDHRRLAGIDEEWINSLNNF